MVTVDLMLVFMLDRQIFLTRHGQSEDNVVGRIGGDAPVSVDIELYNVIQYLSIYVALFTR